MYDTVAQYGQVLGDDVDDWHPPIMVRIWQALHLLADGTAPMFAVQASFYAFGAGTIVAGLVQTGRWRSAAGAAIVLASPLVLGWQMVVLKDGQMEGALLAAFAIVAHYRLADRRIPAAVGVLVALLIGYATLVRANAVFVTAPLAVFLLRRPTSLRARALLVIGMTLAALAITPLINHRVLGARTSDIRKSQPIFDLAAIGVAAPSSPSAFTSAELHQIAKRHCAKAFFWDPLGDPTACAPYAQRLMGMPASTLYLDLGTAVLSHPLLYVRHRLLHWNSTERWLVSPGLLGAAPPIQAEPNDLGLEGPKSGLASKWQDFAASEAATPIGWPILWFGASLCLIPAAWSARSTASGELALALLLSSLALDLSFLVISIASDLRYHLWPMTAVPLALILLGSDFGPKGRRWYLLAAALATISLSGVMARSTLPRAPASYQGMIHWADVGDLRGGLSSGPAVVPMANDGLY